MVRIVKIEEGTNAMTTYTPNASMLYAEGVWKGIAYYTRRVYDNGMAVVTTQREHYSGGWTLDNFLLVDGAKESDVLNPFCPVCCAEFTDEEVKEYREYGAEYGCYEDEFPPFCTVCAEAGWTDM